MNLEEKLSRIRKLSQIQYPSDQEINEKFRLEEEVRMEYNESHPPEPIKKRKRSIMEILIQKLKKKPVTYEQIERLKNERIVEYLKRDIAKAKYERKNPGGKKLSKKQGETIPKLFPDTKEIKSRPQDFINMSGDNNPKKYKGLLP